MRSRGRTLAGAIVAALVAAFVLAPLARTPLAQRGGPPIVVLVSIDGFRWDYIERPAARNLRALAARGVRVRELIPSFPVLTFPNHYTLVTGLYPAHHGIVANAFVDPATGERFSMSPPAVRESRWWGGEPLWVTVERQGSRAAVMFWPGSEAEIGGVRPSRWEAFDSHLPADARVARIIEWLQLPEAERPSFVSVYFDDVDHAGHDYGPDAPETSTAIATVDGMLGRLVAAVHRLGLDDRVTLVVVSDHGMTPLAENRVIWLDDYIDVESVDVTEWEGVLALAPKTGTVDDVYRRLRDAHPRVHVYTRDTLPARLHYRGNPRIAPIIGIPDDGWTVTSRARRARPRPEGRTPVQRGAHGYDPTNPRMHALFVAAGPDIRRGFVSPPIENVNVYDFLCEVLKLPPAPNDGDPAATRGFFVDRTR